MEWDDNFQFEAIGTAWSIQFKGIDKSKLTYLIEKIQQEISDFSSIFSRFDKNSKIWKLSQIGGEIEIPQKYLPLTDIYWDLYKSTNGLFTPLIGNLISDSGYDADYSLKSKKPEPVLNWGEIIEYNPPILKLKNPWLLDFGAAGKGFIVDLIGKLLEDEKITDYCIDAGGDIFYKTKSSVKLKVGLEHPEDFTKIIGVAEIVNKSICGSAGNRRKWGNLHHILNPKKLDSVCDILAVWVIAENTLIADALSTCLFFTQAEILSANFKFEFLIIYPDFSFKKSENFPVELYLA